METHCRRDLLCEKAFRREVGDRDVGMDDIPPHDSHEWPGAHGRAARFLQVVRKGEERQWVQTGSFPVVRKDRADCVLKCAASMTAEGGSWRQRCPACSHRSDRDEPTAGGRTVARATERTAVA